MIKIKIKWSKIIWIVVILIITSILSHIVDQWTIPIRNEITVAQLNGGDSEMVIMHSTNSLLLNFRMMIWPISFIIVGIIIVLEVLKIKNKKKK